MLQPCCHSDKLLGRYLEVSALRLEPVLDEVLRVVAEAQHEVSLSLQLVYGLYGLMYLMRNRKSNTLLLGFP